MVEIRLATTCSILVLIGCSTHEPQPTLIPSSKTKIQPYIFTGDSGFATKQELIPYLFTINGNDTSHLFWKPFEAHDTICKYYRIANGHYCAFFFRQNHSISEGHVVVELDSTGKFFRKEIFSSNCWYDDFGEIKKCGDYLYYECCINGSDYNGFAFFLFKLPVAQDSLTVFYSDLWNGLPHRKFSEGYESTFSLAGDKLTMHYKLEHAPVDTVGLNYNVCDWGLYDVQYVFKDNRWMVKDTLLLKKKGDFSYRKE
jgi:hypothetical protein